MYLNPEVAPPISDTAARLIEFSVDRKKYAGVAISSTARQLLREAEEELSDGERKALIRFSTSFRCSGLEEP